MRSPIGIDRFFYVRLIDNVVISNDSFNLHFSDYDIEHLYYTNCFESLPYASQKLGVPKRFT